MIYIVYGIHVLICLFLILVVLLQQGSGADLSVFGGGGTQTAFGARSATNLLHKLTVAGFVGFILTTIAIGFLKTGGGSVMSTVEGSAPAAPAAETAVEAPAVEEAVPATEGEAGQAPDADLAEPTEGGGTTQDTGQDTGEATAEESGGA